jgi:hypothetical protein
MSHRRSLVILVSLFVLTFAATTVVATNRWGSWKYANATINFYNGATGDYYNIYDEEAITDSNSWHNYTDLSLTRVGAAGSTDHINAYAGSYGSTGWLGIAEIQRTSGSIILQGRSRLNNSYLVSYSRTNKEHVACQEIGHLFGLDHNRGSSTTCMNDQILTAPQPNSHDQSMINSIY